MKTERHDALFENRSVPSSFHVVRFPLSTGRRRGSLALILLTACCGAGLTRVALAADASAPTQTLLVNRLGWPADAPKTVLARDAGTFQVVDEGGKVVASGELVAAPTDLDGVWYVGHFDQVTADGYYQVTCKSGASTLFAVGKPAVEGYRRLADALVAGFGSRRAPVKDALEPKLGGRNENCANDGIRSDNHQHQDYGGGWFDADDTRKFSFTVAISCETLVCAATHGEGFLDTAAALEEAAWGAEFLMKCQEPTGWFIYGKDSPMKYLTGPDRKETGRIYCVEPHHLTAQWRCVGALAGFAAAAEKSPSANVAALAKRARTAALRARDHLRSEAAAWAERADPVRKYRSGTSDMREDPVDHLEAELFASVQLYRLTADVRDLDKARELAKRRADLQVIEPVGGISGMLRYGEDDPNDNPQKLTWHVPKIGGVLPWLALTELGRLDPGGPWKKCLTRTADGYLRPLAARNAFDHIPFGIFTGPGPERRGLGDNLHYRIFKGRPTFPFTSGRSAVILNEAAGLAAAGRDQKRAEWMRLAWRQIDYVLGANPYGHMPRGCVVRMPNPTKGGGGAGRLDFRTSVTVQNGVLGDEKDQSVPPRSWPGEEIWLPNSSAMLMALVQVFGAPKATP